MAGLNPRPPGVMVADPGIVAGFYGKLPARGDFVRFALPGAFVDSWDTWLQRVIVGSRAQMGENWLPAYLEAPVWRFALPPACCGASSVLGLMLPSVDRAGRYFPLTFAALAPIGPDIARQPRATEWLDRCEAAGRTALADDVTPDQLGAMLDLPTWPPGATTLSQSLWWTDGAPRVPPASFTQEGMPDPATFAHMLDAQQAGPSATNTGARVAWEQPS
ncbi:MAG TPA: type VI secretion system-associated protein TagF [Acetobacteraceae bacterium]|nr:type VI secretion system-associated protein TagF [Acetobacteraceae bacterium]